MCFKQIKKETKFTLSRKIKKNQLKRFYLFTFNSNFYLTSFKYNLLKHFFKKQSINLNRKIVHKLLKEELGFMFSLNT